MATAGLSILMFFALALASTEAAAKNSKGHKEDHAVSIFNTNTSCNEKN